jgi:ERF superfamily
VDTGDTLEFGGPVFPVKGEPQATGSALTYYRRYALTTLFALNVEDDDGAQAQRAAVSPDHRTEAEAEVRRIGAAMDETTREQFVHDFKAHFGCTLRHLGESRHGDALLWSKNWQSGIVQEVMDV